MKQRSLLGWCTYPISSTLNFPLLLGLATLSKTVQQTFPGNQTSLIVSMVYTHVKKWKGAPSTSFLLCQSPCTLSLLSISQALPNVIFAPFIPVLPFSPSQSQFPAYHCYLFILSAQYPFSFPSPVSLLPTSFSTTQLLILSIHVSLPILTALIFNVIISANAILEETGRSNKREKKLLESVIWDLMFVVLGWL